MDHFPGNPVCRFSNPYVGIFGFFTAALGFVFFSGLVAGTVYERHRVTDGTRSMLARITRRIRDLYAAIALFPPHPDMALRLFGVVVAVASLSIPAQVHAMIRRREAPFRAEPVTGALEIETARRAA
jgi:hypothetical protein